MAGDLANAELREGSPAPDIALLSSEGKPFRLSELRGRKVILYFYPRAFTPGCVAEACSFRDSHAPFSEANATIVGVSPDRPDRLARFKARLGLPFILLSDPAGEAARAYGVLKQKTLFGRKIQGVERSTFVIDESGVIRKIYRRVRPAGHAEAVLKDLSNL